MFTNIISEINAIYLQQIMWFVLGTEDIKLRYRRSILGPLWITISMAITICSMGILYGKLFHIDINNYMPYLASGIIGWSFISALLLESGQILIESETYIRNQESFISIFVMRLITRNTLVFLHNLLAFVVIIIFFKLKISYKLLFLIPHLFIIWINAFFYCTVLAIISTRYRDVSQISSSLIQVIFFLTPVMWMSDLLPPNVRWIVEYNPFYHFLNLIRAPLLSTNISDINWTMILLVSTVGFGLYSALVSKYKYRIVFWL